QREHRVRRVLAGADDIGAAGQRAADRGDDRERCADEGETDGEAAELGHGRQAAGACFSTSFCGSYFDGQLVMICFAASVPAPYRPSTTTSRPSANMSGRMPR